MATPGNQLSSKPRCPPGPCIGTGLVRYSIRAKELYPANIHMLEKLAARTSPLLDQASQHPVGKFLLTQSRLKLVLHFAFFTTFSILGAVLIWPTFGGDYPPGVDTATFLHLSWVTKLAASGDLSNPFQDPYWYGGFPYLQAYPPLGYGLVGVISFITKIDLVNVYVALLVMAYGGLGLVTYWLAAEQGLSRWASALAAVLTMLAYPVLSSIILWGWFTSLMSLPFALIGFLLLQRSLRTGNWKLSVWGDIFMAVSIMIHHMTGISVGLGMAGWFLFHSTSRAYPIKQLLADCSVFLAVTALVTATWGIPFTIHVLDVGFRREVAGLWRPDLSTYSSNIIDSSLIGGFVYPSYLGITLLVLATGGTVFALIEARHLAGVAVALLVLVWFSMGVDLSPLIRVYLFTALDVARFHLFMVPFMTLLGAALVERLISFLKEIWPSLPPAFRSGRARYLWPSFVVLANRGGPGVPCNGRLESQGPHEPLPGGRVSGRGNRMAGCGAATGKRRQRRPRIRRGAMELAHILDSIPRWPPAC